jgi:thioredoxin 1
MRATGYNPDGAFMPKRFLFLAILLSSLTAAAQMLTAAFNGVDQWKTALASSNAASLNGLYSVNPPARFIGKDGKPADNIAPETDFWQQMISSGITGVEVTTGGEQDQNGLHIASLEVSMKVKTADGPRTRYVMEQQAWQQQPGGWHIVLATHSELLKMRPALKPNPHLYDKEADARVEIKEALATASKRHQRVILIFGGNWCYDCHVLDQAFHEPDVAPIVDKNFQVVHVDIGDDGKKNNDLADEYKVPLDKGVPALAILGADGKLVYSQENGEWESARSLDPDDVITFLNKWKP